MDSTWAKVDGNNIVVNVECASPEWVEQWELDNPDSPYRYVATDLDSKGYAGIGFLLDEPTGWFIPPMPEEEGTWVFDRDPEVWAWINTDPPPDPEDTPE